MSNPEQVPQFNRKDDFLPWQEKKPEASPEFMSEIFAKACAERLQNNELMLVADSRKQKTNSKMTDNKASESIEKEGNIDSLKLPGGFSKRHSDRNDNFLQFNSASDKNTRVNYWKRSDFHADEEDNERIDEVMKKAPHKLDEQETLDLLPLMKPGRPWGNGNYKDLSLSTQDIDGRRVLVADFKFEDQGKRVHLIIANPNDNNHQVDNIWLEGPIKDFDKTNQAVLDSFKSIKWTNKTEK